MYKILVISIVLMLSCSVYAQETANKGFLESFFDFWSNVFGLSNSNELSADISQESSKPDSAGWEIISVDMNDNSDANSANTVTIDPDYDDSDYSINTIDSPDYEEDDTEALFELHNLGDGPEVFLEHKSFYSKSLGMNKNYNVLLPPSYYSTEKRYPVVYLMNGLFGNENAWIKNGNIIETYKNLIENNKIDEMIIAMPDGDNSAYENGCSGSIIFSCGNYESFIIKDFISEIDSNYRTLPSRERRAIGGLSLGARGAMRLAFFHPELFSSVAGHSGKYSQVLSEMTPENLNNLKKYDMSIYFDHSAYDLVPGYLESSRMLDAILTRFSIAHEYHEVSFSVLHSHDWPFWKQQIAIALQKECSAICPRTSMTSNFIENYNENQETGAMQQAEDDVLQTQFENSEYFADQLNSYSNNENPPMAESDPERICPVIDWGWICF